MLEEKKDTPPKKKREKKKEEKIKSERIVTRPNHVHISSKSASDNNLTSHTHHYLGKINTAKTANSLFPLFSCGITACLCLALHFPLVKGRFAENAYSVQCSFNKMNSVIKSI